MIKQETERDTGGISSVQKDIYQTIINILPQAIYTCDASGYIRTFNAAAVDLWGRIPEAGKDLWCGSWKIYNSDQSPVKLDECPMAITLKEMRKVYGHEIIIERPDGTRKNILPYPQPLFDEDGSLTGAVNLLVDITSLKEIEKHRDDFISIASHELRTPLTSIKLYLQLIEESLQQPELKPYIEKVLENTNKINLLISDLLDMSKAEAGRLYISPVAFDIVSMLNDAVESLQINYPSHNLMITGCPESCFVLADRQRIEQVLSNLISNAVKYSPNTDSVRIHAVKKDGFIEISVADSGIGIDPQEVPKIFDRYYRAASSGFRISGLGMGLYITKDIVEKHGGRIWAESIPGQGSRFYFTLPCE